MSDEVEVDTVEIIASALRAKFEDHALAVAEMQARLASPESRETWELIVRTLTIAA